MIIEGEPTIPTRCLVGVITYLKLFTPVINRTQRGLGFVLRRFVVDAPFVPSCSPQITSSANNITCCINTLGLLLHGLDYEHRIAVGVIR